VFLPASIPSVSRNLASILVMASPGTNVAIANVLPPLFVHGNILTIWSVYVFLHLMPMLQNEETKSRGIQQTVISQFLTIMLIICLLRATLTNPGTTPDTPEWRMGGASDSSSLPLTREVKLSGERRHCKWCLKYKPDRCHHCRLCKSCVLRMDHHCPWIMNCVGWRNHKFFFLLVVYAMLTCVFVFATEVATVQESMDKDMPNSNRFLLVLGLTLSVIMGTLLILFLMFHTWLMLNGMTTIEHCERRSAEQVDAGSPYDQGLYGNLKDVLGPRPIFWFLPFDPPEGDGITYKKKKFSGSTPF